MRAVGPSPGTVGVAVGKLGLAAWVRPPGSGRAARLPEACRFHERQGRTDRLVSGRVLRRTRASCGERTSPRNALARMAVEPCSTALVDVPMRVSTDCCRRSPYIAVCLCKLSAKGLMQRRATGGSTLENV
jgi:hypothetical protein